jgi:hypothetical protein
VDKLAKHAAARGMHLFIMSPYGRSACVPAEPIELPAHATGQ